MKQLKNKSVNLRAYKQIQLLRNQLSTAIHSNSNQDQIKLNNFYIKEAFKYLYLNQKEVFTKSLSFLNSDNNEIANETYNTNTQQKLNIQQEIYFPVDNLNNIVIDHTPFITQSRGLNEAVQLGLISFISKNKALFDNHDKLIDAVLKDYSNSVLFCHQKFRFKYLVPQDKLCSLNYTCELIKYDNKYKFVEEIEKINNSNKTNEAGLYFKFIFNGFATGEIVVELNTNIKTYINSSNCDKTKFYSNNQINYSGDTTIINKESNIKLDSLNFLFERAFSHFKKQIYSDSIYKLSCNSYLVKAFFNKDLELHASKLISNVQINHLLTEAIFTCGLAFFKDNNELSYNGEVINDLYNIAYNNLNFVFSIIDINYNTENAFVDDYSYLKIDISVSNKLYKKKGIPLLYKYSGIVNGEATIFFALK